MLKIITKSSHFPMIASAVCAIFVMLVKGIAYVLTDSQAIFADFMESLLHIGTVAITTISLWYAAKPPDREHRYGHGKVAYFSAAFEGLLVLATGGATLYTSMHSFIGKTSPHNLSVGLILVAIVIAVNGILGKYLLKAGKSCNNAVLVSHGYHVLSDMWTSLGVILGLAATLVTGYARFDSIVGSIVALWILFTGGKVCIEAFQGLMERIDDHVDTEVTIILDKAMKEKLIGDYHQLRHRRVNDTLWIDVHLLFDGKQTLHEVHKLASELELEIIKNFPKDTVHVNTHLEPMAHKSAHPTGHPDRKPKDKSDS